VLEYQSVVLLGSFGAVVIRGDDKNVETNREIRTDEGWTLKDRISGPRVAATTNNYVGLVTFGHNGGRGGETALHVFCF
jgi:hypothetical protein